jgi:hypothetical protein
MIAQEMSDREKTKLLTKIGFLFLKQMGCYAIGTEISIHRREYDLVESGDCHYIMDLLGVEQEYWREGSRDITRGIEVKVSRSDFRKGFIHHGCTFNYLMMPVDLVKKDELPSGIGLIEVDLPEFNVHTIKGGGTWTFVMSGVAVTKNARRESADPEAIQRCKQDIARKLTNQTKWWLIAELERPRKQEEKEKAQV